MLQLQGKQAKTRLARFVNTTFTSENSPQFLVEGIESNTIQEYVFVITSQNDELLNHLGH